MLSSVFDLFFKVCRWLVKQLLGLCQLAYKWGWQEPKEARGWKWTMAAWVFFPCAIYLTHLLYETGKNVTPFLFAEGAAWWVMEKTGKPKLPYRPVFRRRR